MNRLANFNIGTRILIIALVPAIGLIYYSTSIVLSKSKLAQSGSDPKETERMLDMAFKAAERGKGLTKQLITFSKGGDPVRKIEEIDRIVKESATFALTGSECKVEFSFPDSLHLVEVDEGQISQVIHNLVVNASRAMQGGGTIRISAENVASQSGRSAGAVCNRFVKVAVQDNGVGISPENINKIFDPYFTTKQEMGHGLGLAAVHSIVKKHGGRIEVDSEVGSGTTFNVFLSACADDRAAQLKDKYLTRSSEDDGLCQPLKILVMDDEECIREIARLSLTEKGHSVTVAVDGSEATDQFKTAQEEQKPFDVVVLDLTVPGGMGGKKTVQKLLKIEPEVTAIACSGYAEDPIMANPEHYGFSGIVLKPYTLPDLCATVQHVCSARLELG